MNRITRIEVDQIDTSITIYKGEFGNSAGNFHVEYSGDGGNADMCKITLSGGQYGDLTEIKIVGAWEIQEVAELFAVIASGNINT